MPLTVAIVGRPNVGKSTLFNRLVGRRAALVHQQPGVTRDRREGEGWVGNIDVHLIDTAGLEETTKDTMEESMRAQTEQALDDADVALMLIDARAGITPLDRHFTDWIRRRSTPVILVANKCEGRGGQAGLLEAYELGLGDPVPISAEHAEGIADLRDRLEAFVADDEVPGDETEEGPESALQLAIVGRPNVGKSTLLNRLVGEERVITGPEPGVTRDAISVEWLWQDRPIRLIDTAGLRRRARIAEPLEKLSTADALNAIRFAHVVVLVIDAEAVAERQDLTIARQIVDEGRAMVVAINKWDLVANRGAVMRGLYDRLERSLPQARGVPVVTISALTGAGVDDLLPAVSQAYEVWNRRLPTGPLNRWFEQMLERHPPPVIRGRRLRLRYITQVKARPPSFVVFASRPSLVPDSYVRYLENGLRDSFDLPGVPIRIGLRRGKNPYVPE
jgi:GTP-binding protein